MQLQIRGGFACTFEIIYISAVFMEYFMQKNNLLLFVVSVNTGFGVMVSFYALCKALVPLCLKGAPQIMLTINCSEICSPGAPCTEYVFHVQKNNLEVFCCFHRR